MRGLFIAGRRESRVVSVAAVVAVVFAAGCGSSSTSGSLGLPRSALAATGVPKAIPMVAVGQAVWQGMRIRVVASAPVKFVVFTGTHEQLVKPTAKDNMHLMVMLNDVQTGMAIPYASVWATIKKGQRVVYDDRQWPMLSKYMGVHYGNNVALPGPGSYALTLLIGPPQSARHMEYANVWRTPHRVNMTFHWAGA